jgi:hypothetical protein
MRAFPMSLLLVAGLLSGGFQTWATASSYPPCQIRSTTFEGWNAQQITNRWLTLMIVPKLGGRLMQITFGGIDHGSVGEASISQSEHGS